MIDCSNSFFVICLRRCDSYILFFAGISDGAQLVVMIRLNVYNEVAGQTKIDGAKKDDFGNAAGNNFDLARDGAFRGAKICVLHFYTFGGFDFRYPQGALEQKGFEIKRFTTCPSPSELKVHMNENFIDSCMISFCFCLPFGSGKS